MSPVDGIITATGDLFPKVTGVTTSKGVAMNPPPAAILGDVSRMVGDAMRALPPGSKTGLVAIATQKNGKVDVNLALATRAGNHVEIVSWMGKSWGAPVEGGVAVQVHF